MTLARVVAPMATYVLRPLALVSVAFALAACGRGQGAPAGGGMGGARPPAVVSVIEARPMALPAVYEYVGQTLGSREVEVRAQVTGILRSRNFQEGATVKAGQSLYTIDTRPYQAALERAEADIAVAEAQAAQAERDLARLKPLYEAKAVSQKELDDAQSNQQIAVANMKSARARAAEARLNVSYARVNAPISGVTSRSLRSEGALVSGPDVLLTTVTQIDPIDVLFGIPDADQARLREDVRAGRLTLPKDSRFVVEVLTADGRLYNRQGKLDFADVRVSQTTGTVESRATLPNPDALLRPGQFVRVRLTGATRPNAIRIPARAVLEGPQGRFAYVVNAQNQAEPRPVQLGDYVKDEQGQDHWIINNGLAAGDRVIVDGVMKIGPGAPVQIATANDAGKPEAGQAAPAAPAKETK
ncbi:MAG TPA: efflux RND transporter periplasmic adaptor subunit [Burkholderiaceae bacterium]|nr:efflux RND transporter periplasmic adaptor subunit [Burkholderiaceae bacterium]